MIKGIAPEQAIQWHRESHKENIRKCIVDKRHDLSRGEIFCKRCTETHQYLAVRGKFFDKAIQIPAVKDNGEEFQQVLNAAYFTRRYQERKSSNKEDLDDRERPPPQLLGDRKILLDGNNSLKDLMDKEKDNLDNICVILKDKVINNRKEGELLLGQALINEGRENTMMISMLTRAIKLQRTYAKSLSNHI